jgi:predicted DsbA family dithiol-disulfide isomerase
MAKTIQVFSDYACPWCYLGLARLRKATEGQDVEVVLLPFPLSPDTPEAGRAVKPYLAARGLDLEAMRTRMAPMLDEMGLPWNDSDDLYAYNTARAQELAVWASHHAPDTLADLHAVLFRMFQVDNRNLWQLDVLREAAVEVGLDADAAIAAVEAGTHTAEVRAWWSKARQIGVTGVPTFIAGGRGMAGAQPVAVLADFVRHA